MAERIHVIEHFASGGMADIFIAAQSSGTGFSKLVAAKKIREAHAKNQELVEMFREEANLGQMIQHTNVVQVMDFVQVGQSFALIMELVKGFNYSTVLKKFFVTPMSPLAGAYVIGESAKGLAYVHDAKDPKTGDPLNVVHRDISPANILISIEGEVKVTDFGIAKANTAETETQVGVIKGKFTYMSPEQFRGERVDRYTDIFALGIVLWESLIGRKMYDGVNEAQLIQKINKGPNLTPLKELNPNVPDELSAITLKCLSPQKQDRYASCLELYRDISSYLAKEGYTSADFKSFLQENFSLELSNIEQKFKSVYSRIGEQTISHKLGEEAVALEEGLGSLLKGRDLELNESTDVRLVVGSQKSVLGSAKEVRYQKPAASNQAVVNGSELSTGWQHPVTELGTGWSHQADAVVHRTAVRHSPVFETKKRQQFLFRGFLVTMIVAPALLYLLQYELGIDVLKSLFR
jgi:serine/threonine protein kinase